MIRKPSIVITALMFMSLTSGCARVAASTLGAAASVGKTAAKTGAGAAGAAVDVATPDRKAESHDEEHGGHHDDNPRPFDETRNAMFDVDVALSAAQFSGHRVLLVLGGNWCHDSRGLAAKFEEPELAAVIDENYHLVWVDVGHRDRNLDVARRFGVEKLIGTPTVLILSPDGALLNEDSAHDWRTADSKPYNETLAYFRRFAGAEGD